MLNKKLLIINITFLTLLGYITFSYLKTESTQTPVLKQAVLGVSQTIDQLKVDNEKLMRVLVSENRLFEVSPLIQKLLKC